MPTTSITIDITTPTAIPISHVVDVLSAYWGYMPTIPDPANPGQSIPNPQTKAQFLKRRIAQFVKDSYVSAKADTGAEGGRQAAIGEADQVSAT